MMLPRTGVQDASPGLSSARPSLDFSNWPIWPAQEAFGDPKSPGNKPSNEGHGFSRAVNSRLLRFGRWYAWARATGAVISFGLNRAGGAVFSPSVGRKAILLVESRGMVAT